MLPIEADPSGFRRSRSRWNLSGVHGCGRRGCDRFDAPADTAWRSGAFGERKFRGACALIFACSELDAWPVVVNPRLSARELDQIYTHSGARRFLITTEIIARSGRSRCAADGRLKHRSVRSPKLVSVRSNEATEPEPIDGGRSTPGRRADVHVRNNRPTERRDAQPS